MDFIPYDTTEIQVELLQKILPLGFDKKYIETSSRLGQGSKEYTNLCILFTDIVSYTELAKKHDSTIIYNLLNNVYILFDKIIKKYKTLQKIETIGDAYMVVGDLYNNNNNFHETIKEIILLGLEFIESINTIYTPDKIPLTLRVGIHIGKVSVGLLGNEIPRLCIIGNAVNYAARLQSTANVDTIQISYHIYEIAQTMNLDIEFIEKENVFLKGIGSVKTYNICPKKNKDSENIIII